MKERILDIGTGYGGRYIGREQAGKRPNDLSLRVCTDSRFGASEHCRSKWNVDAVTMDVEQSYLPFSDNSFGSVEIYFPHGSLLYRLAHSHELWEEFNRITINEQAVRLLFDIPPEGYRIALSPDGQKRLYAPDLRDLL